MATRKVRLVSPGCAKNAVDAEVMLGALQARGYEQTLDEREADVIIVTTCSFVKAARQASISLILDAAELKQTGRCQTLVAAGCFPQRYQEALAGLLPEVDLFIGTGDYPEIASLLEERARTGRQVFRVGSPDRCQDEAQPRTKSPSGRYAYLKIGEGCSSGCTYCIIPKLRGRQRSRSLPGLLAEARQLVSEGVNELVVISQDPTKYGQDLPERPTLAELLQHLADLGGLEWLWLQYVNPDGVGDDLIATMRDEPKIRKFLSVQIQHISDPVLRRMNRRTTAAEIRETVAKLRREIPALILGTCAIVGFPGETEADYRQLLEVVEEGLFDFMSVFPYSPEEGTPAARMRDPVPEEVRRRRYVELSQARASLWPKRMRAFLDTTLEVIVEGYAAPPPEVHQWLRGRAHPKAGRGRALRLPVLAPGRAVEDPTSAPVGEPEEYEDVFTLSEILPDGIAEHIQLERLRRRLQAEAGSAGRHRLPGHHSDRPLLANRPPGETEMVLAGRSSFQIPGQGSKTYLVEGTAAAGDVVKVRVRGLAGLDLVGAILPGTDEPGDREGMSP